MKLLIISDTHTDSIAKLPSVIRDEAKNCDGVIHAGDVVSLRLLNELSELNGSIHAVKGNMDFTMENHLPLTKEIEMEGVRIGICHGAGNPFGIENRLLYTFPDADIIIFGHTHRPFYGMVGGKFMLNPGSPVQNRGESHNSYAILTLDKGVFHAEIKRIEQ